MVINDTGADSEGCGRDETVARAAAEALRRQGYQAMASTDDVATEAGGAALIAGALDRFGRIDMLIANAGSVVMQHFSDMPLDAMRAQMNVHYFSAWYVGQPAWRVMRRQNYGRNLLVSSMGIFGAGGQGGAPYASGKIAMQVLARFLSAEAAEQRVDIKVNTIAPYADSRLTGESDTVCELSFSRMGSNRPARTPAGSPADFPALNL